MDIENLQAMGAFVPTKLVRKTVAAKRPIMNSRVGTPKLVRTY